MIQQTSASLTDVKHARARELIDVTRMQLVEFFHLVASDVG